MRSFVGKALLLCVIGPSLQGGPDRLFRAIGNGRSNLPGQAKILAKDAFTPRDLPVSIHGFRDRSPTMHYTLEVYSLRRPPQPRRLPGCSLKSCRSLQCNASQSPVPAFPYLLTWCTMPTKDGGFFLSRTVDCSNFALCMWLGFFRGDLGNLDLKLSAGSSSRTECIIHRQLCIWREFVPWPFS